MTGNTVYSACKNCGLDITKNDVEARTKAIECVEYHIGELKTQIKALEKKKTLLAGELEALKNEFCTDCAVEYKAQKFDVECTQLRTELKGFMETV